MLAFRYNETMDDKNNNAPDGKMPVNITGGGINKEHQLPGALDIPLQEIDVKEYEIPKEVSAHMQIQPHKPDIPPDLTAIGVTHSPSDQTVSGTVTVSNSIPLTDDQINEGKQQPPTNSFRWLAEFCLKQLKYAGIHLMKVKGRYIRIPSENKQIANNQQSRGIHTT